VIDLDENKEDVARELRTIADRIEDGEYPIMAVRMEQPSGDGDGGHVKLDLQTIETFERMHVAFSDDPDA